MHSNDTQAVIGSNLMFFNVFTGFPGSMHDPRVLKNAVKPN